MKRENPAKKHHFWLLLGVVPLLTLIAVLMISSQVGGKIEARQKQIKKANDEIAATKMPKPAALITELDKVSTVVEKKQGDLHKENWGRQKALFTWPGRSAVFADLAARNMKFGDPIPDLSAVFGEFQRVETYQAEYSNLKKDATGAPLGAGTGMADLMAPTQFKGGWQSVIRYVNDFGDKVTHSADLAKLFPRRLEMNDGALQPV